MAIEDSPYKFISGMGMSIGNFICGTIKQKCNEKNLNRYLQMEPFPFTSSTDNARHRECMIKKAGIFIFIIGYLDENFPSVEESGMWKEYILAKNNKDNIIIPLPCGADSISSKIYYKELAEIDSFSARYSKLLNDLLFLNSSICFLAILFNLISFSFCGIFISLLLNKLCFLTNS